MANFQSRATRGRFSKGDQGDMGISAFSRQQDDIIKFLDLSRRQAKERGDTYVAALKGVAHNENRNREIIQELKNDIYKTKLSAVKTRGQREVEALRGEAAEAGKWAEYWGQFSQTGGKVLGQLATGIMQTADVLEAERLQNQDIVSGLEEKNIFDKYTMTYSVKDKIFHGDGKKYKGEIEWLLSDKNPNKNPAAARKVSQAGLSGSVTHGENLLAKYNASEERYNDKLLEDFDQFIQKEGNTITVRNQSGQTIEVPIDKIGSIEKFADAWAQKWIRENRGTLNTKGAKAIQNKVAVFAKSLKTKYENLDAFNTSQANLAKLKASRLVANNDIDPDRLKGKNKEYQISNYGLAIMAEYQEISNSYVEVNGKHVPWSDDINKGDGLFEFVKRFATDPTTNSKTDLVDLLGTKVLANGKVDTISNHLAHRAIDEQAENWFRLSQRNRTAQKNSDKDIEQGVFIAGYEKRLKIKDTNDPNYIQRTNGKFTPTGIGKLLELQKEASSLGYNEAVEDLSRLISFDKQSKLPAAEQYSIETLLNKKVKTPDDTKTLLLKINAVTKKETRDAYLARLEPWQVEGIHILQLHSNSNITSNLTDKLLSDKTGKYNDPQALALAEDYAYLLRDNEYNRLFVENSKLPADKQKSSEVLFNEATKSTLEAINAEEGVFKVSNEKNGVPTMKSTFVFFSGRYLTDRDKDKSIESNEYQADLNDLYPNQDGYKTALENNFGLSDTKIFEMSKDALDGGEFKVPENITRTANYFGGRDGVPKDNHKLIEAIFKEKGINIKVSPDTKFIAKKLEQVGVVKNIQGKSSGYCSAAMLAKAFTDNNGRRPMNWKMSMNLAVSGKTEEHKQLLKDNADLVDGVDYEIETRGVSTLRDPFGINRHDIIIPKSLKGTTFMLQQWSKLGYQIHIPDNIKDDSKFDVNSFNVGQCYFRKKN